MHRLGIRHFLERLQYVLVKSLPPLAVANQNNDVGGRIVGWHYYYLSKPSYLLRLQNSCLADPRVFVAFMNACMHRAKPPFELDYIISKHARKQLAMAFFQKICYRLQIATAIISTNSLVISNHRWQGKAL